MQNQSSESHVAASFVRRYLGVGAVLIMVGAFELLRSWGWIVPNPPAFLILAIIYAACTGGVVPGLIASTLSCLYLTRHFSRPGQLFEYADPDVVRMYIWVFTLPLTVMLIGFVQRRARRSGVEAEGRRGATALRRMEETRRLVVEHALDPVVTMDDRGIISDWNPAAEQAFGRPREEALGRAFQEFGIVDKAREAFQERLASLRRTGDAEQFHDRFEGQAMRRDGTEFPAEFSLFAVRSNGGFACCAFVRDISERRQSDRRHEVMMRELDHRVKNNLAAVLAIVDQTAARSETLDEFMTNFRGRVVAMARLHSSLAACRWRGGELQALVRQTLEPYTHDTEGRVVLKGSVVTLPPAAVSSVCMALHELATNASRYGALSVPEGRVLVEWKVLPAQDGTERLRLLWSEEGGPRVDAPSRYGFGRQLIEEGVPYEAGGESNLTFSPTGVTCELVVPLGAPDPSGAA